ncbi:MAG: RDD family protein [Akkermansiaceae bacterium]|nr:RDD family protein [Akkermansiaceae bacterium]MCF7731975.1 RDD family protein [Akkermansiaceae bacterium]
MELWLILDGEKSGPFQDYEIRSRIAAGELTRETPVWQQGMAGWRTLDEISLFAGEFERIDQGGEDDEPSFGETSPARRVTDRAGPPPLPVAPAFARRFWARWLDIQTYLAVWWLGMWVCGRPIDAALNSVVLMVVQLVPWFILEAILLSRFGTTPGKWLLGLSVENMDGSRLSLGAATLRSFRVMIGGIGFGWGLLALVCQAFSFYTARRLGRPLWDYAGGHQVRVGPLIGWRIAGVAVGMSIAVLLQMAVISPYILDHAAENSRAIEEVLEKIPFWHQPERE